MKKYGKHIACLMMFWMGFSLLLPVFSLRHAAESQVNCKESAKSQDHSAVYVFSSDNDTAEENYLGSSECSAIPIWKSADKFLTASPETLPVPPDSVWQPPKSS